MTQPADVARTVLAGVSRLITGGLTEQEQRDQLDLLANCYAERTDVRHPFQPLGDTPLRSRAELRAHFAAGPGRTPGVRSFAPAHVVVHETTDPEVAVIEFRYVGSAHGQPFDLPCIFVIRVRDGLIVESRDYADHVAMARAFGRLDDLAAALVRGPS